MQTIEVLKAELAKARAENRRLRAERGWSIPIWPDEVEALAVEDDRPVVKPARGAEAIEFPDAYDSKPYRIDAAVYPKDKIVLSGERPNYDKPQKGLPHSYHVVEPFSTTYRIGDQAIYDGWNFSYFGEIVAIGPKTVTIKANAGGERRRLTIERFCRRNHRDVRFDHDQRANWSD